MVQKYIFQLLTIKTQQHLFMTLMDLYRKYTVTIIQFT